MPRIEEESGQLKPILLRLAVHLSRRSRTALARRDATFARAVAVGIGIGLYAAASRVYADGESQEL
jgi:hypothetical protein